MASCKGSKNFDYLLGNSTTTTTKKWQHSRFHFMFDHGPQLST